jgi:hypothetical protein
VAGKHPCNFTWKLFFSRISVPEFSQGYFLRLHAVMYHIHVARKVQAEYGSWEECVTKAEIDFGKPEYFLVM